MCGYGLVHYCHTPWFLLILPQILKFITSHLQIVSVVDQYLCIHTSARNFLGLYGCLSLSVYSCPYSCLSFTKILKYFLPFFSSLSSPFPFLLVVVLLICISFLDSSLAIPFAVKDEKYGEIISEELLDLFSLLKKRIKTTVTSMKLTVMLPNRNYCYKAFSC